MSIKNFIIHLRWHYQVGILSAGYLLPLLYHPPVSWSTYLLQFLNVHLLLYGGATAYNSYWDMDQGPVGGLKHPPEVPSWTHNGALILMGAGLVWSFTVGWLYAGIYACSLILFWGYSAPQTRWKGAPHISIIVIALSTGTNSFLLGSLASGVEMLSGLDWLTALAVALVLVSLYPCSQIYQSDEDKRRGDETFAIRYGIEGVKYFFGMTYFIGSVLLSVSLGFVDIRLGGLFLIISFAVGIWIYRILRQLTGRMDEYDQVMNIKYGTSISFMLFILLTWTITYYFAL